jgi:hypothetical protein
VIPWPFVTPWPLVVPWPLFVFLVALNAGSGWFEGTVPFVVCVVLPVMVPVGEGTNVVGDTGEPVVGACVAGVLGVLVAVAGGVGFEGVGLGQLAGLVPCAATLVLMVFSIAVTI